MPSVKRLVNGIAWPSPPLPLGKWAAPPFRKILKSLGVCAPPPMEGQRPYQNGKKSGANVASDGIVLGQHGWLGEPAAFKSSSSRIGFAILWFFEEAPQNVPLRMFWLAGKPWDPWGKVLVLRIAAPFCADTAFLWS